MSDPENPLNVLTIDGSDFQGQTSLLILSKLMETIAGERKKSQERTAKREHLRPCDVFDMIGGVGIGGWIAFLLSVFRMSIRECMNEYIKITRAIIRPDKLDEKVAKKFRGSEFDIKMLETHVDRLADEYKTGQNCLERKRDLARCKRSFVVARYRDETRPKTQYCLFRTYRTDGSGDPDVLEPDPESTLLSEAFAATAAMKGCLYPFKLKLYPGQFGSDTFRGCFTNATTPALDQISRLSNYHGQDYRVSTLVNIAPPVPSPADLYKIKHQGSWASVSSKSSNDSTNSGRHSEAASDESKNRFFRRKARSSSHGLNHAVVEKADSNGVGNSLKPITNEGRNGRATSLDARTNSRERRSWNWRDLPVVRRSFRAQKYAEIQRSLQEDRDEHVKETQIRLQQMNPDALYVPLTPHNAPEKTALNDVSALPEAQSNIDEYLSMPEIQERLKTAAVRILKYYGTNESTFLRSGPSIS